VPGAIDLNWRVDTAAISPESLEACLRGMESLIVTAALDAAALDAAALDAAALDRSP